MADSLSSVCWSPTDVPFIDTKYISLSLELIKCSLNGTVKLREINFNRIRTECTVGKLIVFMPTKVV